MTDAEAAAGLAAAEAYEGWEAGFIGATNNAAMVSLVITTADGGADQTAQGRQIAAAKALTTAITNAGYADEVSGSMITAITAAVLQAVSALRAQRS